MTMNPNMSAGDILGFAAGSYLGNRLGKTPQISNQSYEDKLSLLDPAKGLTENLGLNVSAQPSAENIGRGLILGNGMLMKAQQQPIGIANAFNLRGWY